jgi:transcriptional regulator GlxA family with amidase domain
VDAGRIAADLDEPCWQLAAVTDKFSSESEGQMALVKRSVEYEANDVLPAQNGHNGERTAETPLAVPALIRRAERYILGNAGAPITVSDVAAELGVSLRSLQASFRQWRSTTPNLFLRRVRLELVRDELRRLGAQTTVQAVAMRHGFSNLGRFSAYYQAAFGEAPSATLRRGRSPRRQK